jgi:mono/diheme cytochrome c family protein
MKHVPSFVAAALLLGACSDSDTDPDATSAEEVTYREHVAPILQAHCVSCHTEGAIAPFALDDYAMAAAYAESARVAVEERTMPPFSADNSGDCRTYADARWLSDEEIDTIARWVEAGAPEGDGEVVEREPDVRELAGDTVLVEMPAAYQPTAGGADEYRCFDVTLGTDHDVFVTGFEVLPGAPRIVHHVVIWSYDPQAQIFGGGTNEATVAELDGADGKPGWTCGGTGGGLSTAGMPAIWTPGTPVTVFPEGTGLKVPASHRLMFEMHYSVGTTTASDLTRARLQIADEVRDEAQMQLLDGMIQSLFFGDPFVLQPGQADIPFEWSADLQALVSPPGPPMGEVQVPDAIDIYGVFPHMHTRGTRLRAEVMQNDAVTACATDVPRWDFSWQQVFFYEEPLRLVGGESLHITCDYDTSNETEPVEPGFQTSEEMCTFGVFVVKR